VNAESIPLLLVALLLASAGGAQTAQVVMDGGHELSGTSGAVVVAGGDVTIPENTTVDGPLYVAGGDLHVNGTVDGDVTVLDGRASIASTAAVTGALEQYGGSVTISQGGVVDRRSDLPVFPERTLWDTLEFALVEAVAFGLAGLLLGGRLAGALSIVGDAATGHPIVSATVGTLVGVTSLAVAVFMAFTLVLLPVAVVGLLGVGLVAAYGVLSLGFVVGRRFDFASTARETAVGAALVMIGLRAVGFVPWVGALVPLLVIAAGFGAALVTYLGTSQFEPATIPSLSGE